MKERDSIPADSQTMTSESASPTSSAPNRHKMLKSATVLVNGKAKGVINYKPCETQDEKIAAEHRKFQVQPIGCIGDYPRHIPYSSDKKSFQQRTGRDAFEGGKHPGRRAERMLTTYSVPIHILYARG